jgi:hypothetical protein
VQASPAVVGALRLKQGGKIEIRVAGTRQFYVARGTEFHRQPPNCA